ncbi:MAG: hypothetical protein KDA93_26875 [Planctomycetaceae bacterium]|nr:hypothetical protein [Planctomycetaceae bacterium]
MSTDSAISPETSLAVCPQCCHANPPTHHFCENCNAPLSAAAAILPSWRPWAEGALVRRAVRQTDSWLVLIGMWLLFAPSMLLTVILGSNSYPWIVFAQDWKYRSPMSAIIGVVISSLFWGGGGALFGSILFQTTRSFFQNRQMQDVPQSQE